MEIKTRTHVYIDCECGKALEHKVVDGFSEDYTVIVEPCSCRKGVKPAVLRAFQVGVQQGRTEGYKEGYDIGYCSAKEEK